MRRTSLTTIPLKSNTVKKLKRFGMKDETYDELVNRLLFEREMELALPRTPGAPEEIERSMKEGDHVPIAELRKRLGI
jgi:hypothetical protein